MAGNLNNSAYPEFIGALVAVAHDPALGNERFPARNMLMDEGVNVERAEPYLQQAELNISNPNRSWTELHGDYMSEHIFLPRNPRANDGLDSVGQITDTFSTNPDFTRFGSAAPNLSLIRCEEPQAICKVVGKSGHSEFSNADRFLRLLQDFLANPTRQPLRDDLQEVLDIYADYAQSRPIFAAFENDLLKALADSKMWQDNLRNALGLSHYKKDSYMILLRYTVSRIPLVPGKGTTRALVTPTVLDGSLSNAFCPSPVNVSSGHTVHLAPKDFNPCREVLHPWIRWRADDIINLGRILTSPPPDLKDVRALHLLALRDLSGNLVYAEDTDSDLLT